MNIDHQFLPDIKLYDKFTDQIMECYNIYTNMD